MRLFCVSAVLVILAGCTTPPKNRSDAAPLRAVDAVDLDRYFGRWYEIARLPNSFEKNCEGVTADYARRADGLISVVNTCRLGAPTGERKTAVGRARAVDGSNAKLKVSFFGPFWGDYWIIHLAEDYSLAIVGEPSGRYLWVLSRTPTLSPESRRETLEMLGAFGYDVTALYFPAQPPSSD